MLTCQFTNSHAGYGNRSDKVTAQAITAHTVQTTVIFGNVVSVVLNEKWDETGQFMAGFALSLSYHLKMCEKTVWQVWEENSGRVYLWMPADEEIIRHYLP